MISGDTGEQGIQGEAGHTPEFGVDYWTPEQQQEIISTATTNTINNYSSTITQIQSNASNALNTANTANTTANTAKSIAEGANQALSYANYQAMVTAFNSLDDDVYRVGQNVMIITLNVPDLWVSSIESTSASYTYTNDEAITTALSTNGYIQIGYYKLSALETQKVDLTDYYTKTGTENKIEDYLYQIMPTDSTSGAITTIDDATTMFNAVDVTGSIEPVQDLHGQDAPYPAGGGVNLFNPLLIGDYIRYVINDDETITVTGTDGRAWTNVTVIPLSAGTYTIKVYGHKRSQIRTSEDDYMSDINLQNLAYTFTLSADGGIKLKLGLGDTYPITVYVQIESGSSATDWTPYSNVCPISGWTGLNLNRTGINIWDEQWEVGSIDNNTGRETAHSGKIRSKNYIRVVPNISIYVCCNYSGISTWNFFFYDINKNYVERLTGVANAVITVPENCFYMKFRENANTYGTTYNNNISINYPSTDTDYHSGTDNTSVTVDWTDEAGEVYGGSLDVTTGLLTVNRKIITVSSVAYISASYIKSDACCAYILDSSIYPQKSQTAQPDDLTSDKLGFTKQSVWGTVGYPNMFCLNVNQIHINLKNEMIGVTDYTAETVTTAKEKMNAWLAENPVTLTIPVTPLTYQLTPQQISFLQGTNNLWVNTGDISVTYKADIQKYIDKKTN